MRLTEAEYAAWRAKQGQSGPNPAQPAPPRRKYGNVPTVVAGMRFDSKAEAAYYEWAISRWQRQELAYVLRQVPLHLPGGVRLVVDFLEAFPGGNGTRFVDVKGAPLTEAFLIKRKLAQAHYGIEIECVRRVGRTGCVFEPIPLPTR